MYRIASEACTASTGAEMSVAYTYEDDYLTAVTTPTTTYGFTYEDFGLRHNVTIGEYTLATYDYDENHYLEKLDYGNSDAVEYKYDTKGRIEKEIRTDVERDENENRVETQDTVEYKYDNNGNLAKKIDSATGRTTTYYYDLTERMVKYVEEGDNYFHSVCYTYNAKNNLTQLVEITNGVTTTTSYEYDDDNRISWSQTGDTKVVYTYDDYGRVETKVTNVSNTPFKTESFTYVTIPVDDNDPDTEPTSITSSQVETHTVAYGNTSTVYAYTYDDNGNILTVSETTATNDADESTRTSSYVYDSANQLLRENNEEGGYTKTWTYDNAGNITSRNKYAHTTADDLTGLTSTSGSYVYGDDDWGGKLTAYDGRTIAYDNIGNPTSIEATEDGYGRTYTWEHGRQLKTLYDGVDNWTFEYDANGMRTRRYCDWCGYQYTYTGSQLTQMKFEGSTLNFTYDASGTPLTMSIGDAVYYYVTNLQGDVVGLLDATGARVVTYTYDAWGVGLAVTGTKANSIGILNPLRYRGYVYDEETGLYYLQSRYYDPQVGRFINADIFYSTGQGFVGHNMFAYCGNNCVIYADNTGMIPVAVGGSRARQNKDWVENPNKRHGSEKRGPSGDRERNVGHPNGEEHSRVPKGNRGNRGVHRMESVIGLIVTTGAIIWFAGNDISGIGAADDAALIPTVAVWLNYFNMVFA